MRESSRYTPPPLWKTLLEQMQIDPASVLASCRIAPTAFERSEIKVTSEQYFSFWEAVNRALPDGELTQLMARHIAVGPFDASLFIFLCYPSPLAALSRLGEIKPQISPLTLAVTSDGEHTRLTLGRADGAGPVPVMAAMYELMILARFIALASGNRVQLARLELPASIADCRGLFDAIDCGAAAGADVVGCYRTADLAEPFAVDVQVLWRFFEDRFYPLHAIDHGAPVVARVRAALLPLLPTGDYTIARVAKILGLSKRTLQRRLHADGHRFLSVLQQLRVELANHYLTTTQTGLVEVALLLGFANTESLARAYAGWTGQRLRAIRDAQANS